MRLKCARFSPSTELVILVESISEVFRRESGRIVASLIGYCGDFDRAEDAVQDAFAVACDSWGRDGLPPNPGGWIAVTAKRRLIDRLRREAVRGDKEAAIGRLLEMPPDPADVEDDRLRVWLTSPSRTWCAFVSSPFKATCCAARTSAGPEESTLTTSVAPALSAATLKPPV